MRYTTLSYYRYYVITFSYEISNTQFTSWDKEVTNALTDCFILDSSQQLTDVGGRVYNDFYKKLNLKFFLICKYLAMKILSHYFFFQMTLTMYLVIYMQIRTNWGILSFLLVCQKCKSNQQVSISYFTFGNTFPYMNLPKSKYILFCVKLYLLKD